MGEDNVASVMAPQVEQVAGQGCPQVDAGNPGQQGVLEAGSEVRVVGVHRQIGVLGMERTTQCCGSLLQNGPSLEKGGGAPRPTLPEALHELWGSEVREDTTVNVQTSRCWQHAHSPMRPWSSLFPHFPLSLMEV